MVGLLSALGLLHVGLDEAGLRCRMLTVFSNIPLVVCVSVLVLSGDKGKVSVLPLLGVSEVMLTQASPPV